VIRLEMRMAAGEGLENLRATWVAQVARIGDVITAA
jgi:hypothetical protein